MDNYSIIFSEYAKKYLNPLVAYYKEWFNGKEENKLGYLHQRLLRPQYSRNGLYESIQVFNTRVSADFVALDSPLPIKKRDKISKAVGRLAKSGAEFHLNEAQIDNIRQLIQAGNEVPESEIISQLFSDVPKAVSTIPELMERCFLEGLSSGVFCIDDSTNAGAGIGTRIDYGYLNSQKFKCVELWADPTTSKPLTDLRNMVKYAKSQGRDISYLYMDDVTFDLFCESAEVKSYYGWSLGFAGDKTLVPVPTLEQINQALNRDNKYGFTITVVDRTCVVEKDGVQTTVTPWSEGKVIGTQTEVVGTLTWTNVAEDGMRAKEVDYTNYDNGVLISRYTQHLPSLSVYTRVQARQLPIVSNVDGIFQLDTKTKVSS